MTDINEIENTNQSNKVSRLMGLLVLESEHKNEIYAALAKAQATMGAAAKNKTNPFYNSDYADLASVREAYTKSLSDNGLCLLQSFGTHMGNSFLITTLGHSSGQWIKSILPLTIKQKDQEFGSHLSYMRRYASSAITGIAQADDDGNLSSQPAITEDQVTALNNMIKSRGVELTKFTPWLQASIGVDTLENIPKNKFDEVVTAIKSKPIKKAPKND